ncbi:hypothetical protein CRX57_28195 [Pseudomonas putida]|jgi:hypothetical protein|uniref:Uncharacterized protein n=1 Tax=Pseudomonas putida TaxID=303 RepID=A0A2C5WF37_PSEPU|nr:hypothetical protein CRX57_28195 [Pseudomonas putida]
MARDDAFKQSCLYDTRCYVPKATTPCAIAYDYARIRRLVRLECGFYRGSVADKAAIGFGSPVSHMAQNVTLRRCLLAPVFYGGHAQGAFERAGFSMCAGLPTFVMATTLVW